MQLGGTGVRAAAIWMRKILQDAVLVSTGCRRMRMNDIKIKQISASIGRVVVYDCMTSAGQSHAPTPSHKREHRIICRRLTRSHNSNSQSRYDVPQCGRGQLEYLAD